MSFVTTTLRDTVVNASGAGGSSIDRSTVCGVGKKFTELGGRVCLYSVAVLIQPYATQSRRGFGMWACGLWVWHM